ncbi:MAG: Hsp20/alpha crystallin family protein [Bacteroidales bacterium]|nr:Hsp20/alpha crystallin family protein [Bacteroidales bacterium]
MTIARFPFLPSSLLDHFWDKDMMDRSNSNFSATNTSLPAVNIKETNDDFMIEVAAPGMKKEDFSINYDNGRLTISSDKDEEKVDEKYNRREFSYQSFCRSFEVADNVIDNQKINAKYKDGILYITLPKREEIKPKPAKQIEIS